MSYTPEAAEAAWKSLPLGERFVLTMALDCAAAGEGKEALELLRHYAVIRKKNEARARENRE